MLFLQQADTHQSAKRMCGTEREGRKQRVRAVEAVNPELKSDS